MKFRILAVTVVLAGCAALAPAQEPLTLHMANGLVTLHARNVPVRTILAEWARVGGAKIVNGDRVAGAPVTLDLEGVPERQALETILRGVSGYMLAARESGVTGASTFDRIMILPTSAAPRNPPPPVPIFSSAPGAGIVRPIGPQLPDDDLDAEDNPPDDVEPPDQDGDAPPRPINIRRPTPLPFGVGEPVGGPTSPVTPNELPQQNPPGVTVTPSNPFGVPPGSSAIPGMIAPAVPPQTDPRTSRPGEPE